MGVVGKMVGRVDHFVYTPWWMVAGQCFVGIDISFCAQNYLFSARSTLASPKHTFPRLIMNTELCY